MAARAPEPQVLLCLGALLARWVAAGKGRDPEGKVELCQATVRKRESQGLNFSTDPVGAADAEPPGVGLEFPARSSVLSAERNFPGCLMEGKISPVSWSGQPARLQRPAEGRWKNWES